MCDSSSDDIYDFTNPSDNTVIECKIPKVKLECPINGFIWDKIKLNKKNILPQISKESKCCDGCVEVELILQSNEDISRSTLEYMYTDKLNEYKCYQALDQCGHINYAVMSYAAKKGHLDCIKYLHQNTYVMWHNDLAIVAAESDQLECLKYIVEQIGDVSVSLSCVTSEECIKYIKTLCDFK